MVQKKKSRIGKWSIRLCSIITFSFILLSCMKNQDPGQVVSYNGPFMEAENSETRYSDSSVLRILIKAPKQTEMENGNREFPNGVYVEFYNELGQKTTTLNANKGYYYKDQNFYNVKGNVIVKNLVEGEQLNTEELNWDPESKKVNTDKYVRIETKDQILTGVGLDANQDFSYYKIRQPKIDFDNEF